MRVTTSVVCSVFFLSINSLHAQTTIVTCGASKGKIYIVEDGKGTWSDDNISDGAISLIAVPNKGWDIVTKSKRGTLSALADGATVTLTHANAQVISVTASFPMQTVETYQFSIEPKDRKKGFVLWTAARSNSFLITMKAMRAECIFYYEVEK